MAVALAQTAGPSFARPANPRAATADFASNPASGRLIIMGFGGNKNSGAFVDPPGITVPTNGSYVSADVSARLGYGSGVDGGTLSWDGQAEGALAFFEYDAASGWAHRTCAQIGSGSNTQTLTLNPGDSPVDGIAIALVAADSSTGASGPFSNAATIGFTNGYVLQGRYQEAAAGSGDAGGSAFIVATKQLVAGDRTTNTVYTTTGTGDQSVMIIEVIDIAVAASGPEPGRMFVGYGG